VSERFVARPSRFRILLLILGSLGFVALGVWIAGLLGPPPRPGKEFAGWLSILFFGLCFVVGLFRLFERGDVIVVDRQGLFWRRWSDATIPWSAIRSIEPRSIRRNRFLCLWLHDHRQFPPGSWIGRAGAANRALGFGDIAITTAGTDRRFDELLAALERHAPADILTW
jgi:hypothetical protein